MPYHAPKSAASILTKSFMGKMSGKSAVELAISFTGPRPAETGTRVETIEGHQQTIRTFAPANGGVEPDYHRCVRSLRIGHKTL